MQAVILAAGMGKRLLPITEDIPKCMVEVAGVPMVIRNLDQLSKLGTVTEVIIVVGYKKDKVKDLIGEQHNNLKITYVDNDDYNTTNNIYSLWLARDNIKENFILMEGDIVFEYKVLEELMNQTEENIILVAKYEDYMDGTVLSLDFKTKQIKRLITGSEQGENFDYSDKFKTVNMYSFTYEFYQKYFKPNLDLYLNTHGKDSYYELILGILIYIKTPNLNYHIIDNGRWFECDDANDLEIASHMFFDDKVKAIDQISALYGGYWRYDFLDFCYLFNLYFPNKTIYSKLGHELPQLINNYPSAQHKIAKLLSRWYKEDDFNEKNLIVSNGASEIIRILNKNLINKITIPVPTFNEYENELSEEKINYLKLKEENQFNLDKEEFIQSIKQSGSDFGLIINPNNPTGKILMKEDVEFVVKSVDAIIIVDESFIDFTGDREKYSVQDLVGRYPNLVIIRSLSKEFGVPGLRLGYLLTANEKIKEKVKEHLPIWNINSIAEKFLELFIKYKEVYDKSIDKIVEDREYLFKSLKEISYIEPLESYANFILCKLEASGSDLKKELFGKSDILIKDCSNKDNLANDKYVRISIRRKQENDKLLLALKKYGINKGDKELSQQGSRTDIIV
ncbi:MAG: class I and II aminotransferase [Nanoarchaeota archaeon]|nr:class I and II aminotransferase [Nanoarchaeota archaeon]|tara:strand:+ start:2321 stop:4186 length:1866 start_codon:yes stop_codon:yes gene_type:complete